MPDYIPSADDLFNHWATNLVDYLTTDPEAPVLPTATKTALTAGLAAWATPYSEHVAAQSAAQTKFTTKEDARTVFSILLRQTVGDIQRATATTDTQRVAMQVTVPKEGRTAVGEIETYPIFSKIDTSTRLRHRLFFADSETPTSAAKPEGAKFCEIRLSLGGTAPIDPAKMEPLAMESRSPHRNDFDPGDEGKTAYYAARWINTVGDPGPWSPVVSTIVPS